MDYSFVLHALALGCLTLMTGCELCVAAFLQPAIRRLPEADQIAPASGIAAQLGKIMPFWYATSLLLTVADTIVLHHAKGVWVSGASASALVQGLILGLTLGLLVPINNRIARMTGAYQGWLADAQRWDRLHRVRVALLLLSCIALAWR
jgi:hypothetical protein